MTFDLLRVCPFSDHQGYGGVSQVMNTELRGKPDGLDGWVPNVACEVRVAKGAAVGHGDGAVAVVLGWSVVKSATDLG